MGIINFFRTPREVSSRIVQGGILTYVEKFVTKAILFARTIIIARLLFPDDIGLFGLATMAMSVVELLIQPGFESAIIQEKGDVRQYLDAAWTVRVLRGIVLAAILYFIGAPLAALFFNEPAIVLLAKALAAVLIIDGFQNIGMTLLDKELQFNRRFVYNVIGVLVQAIALIIAAYVIQNAWALYIAVLVGNVTYLILSYVLHPYRPRLTMDLSGARHLYRYGKWIGITAVASFVIAQGDFLIVGKVLDTQALGIYQLAFALAMLPAVEIVRSLGGLLFPLYAKLQQDRERIGRVFVRVLRVLVALVVPAAFGLVVLAHEIVGYVYGDRWLAMVPILVVLAFAGLVKTFEMMVIPVMLGIGKPKIQTATLVFESVLLVVLVVIFTQYKGVVGAAWGVLISAIVTQAMLAVMVKRYINVGLGTMGRATFMPLIASFAMVLVLLMTKTVVPISNIGLLFAYVGFGALVYAVFAWNLDNGFGRHIHESIEWIKMNR